MIISNGQYFELKEAYGLGAQKTPDSDDILCVVCLTNKKDVLSLPCRHVSLCDECAKTMMASANKNCPVCRNEIRDI